jgi:hypothetical protein
MTLPTLDGVSVGTKVKNEYTALTGQTVTIAAPYNWLVLTNSGTIAALTVVLPSNPVDGQNVTVSAPTGTISAMTFSPAVVGFTNTSAFTLGTGHIIAYSVQQGAWFIEL